MTDEIVKIKEDLAVLKIGRRAAEKTLNAIKRQENALYNKLNRIEYKRATDAQKKADLTGKNGPVLMLQTAPRTLFEKVKKQKFVLSSCEWLLGGDYRFRAREVGSVHYASLLVTIGKDNLYIDGDWLLTREQAIGWLRAFRDKPREGISTVQAYPAIRRLEEQLQKEIP